MEERNTPNRVRAQFSESSTDWEMIATDGTGHTSYSALQTAGKTPFPGTPSEFPTGCPKVVVRSKTSANADGSPILVATNRLAAPTEEDTLLSGSGQTIVYSEDDVKNIWIKKTVAGDIAVLTGMF